MMKLFVGLQVHAVHTVHTVHTVNTVQGWCKGGARVVQGWCKGGAAVEEAAGVDKFHTVNSIYMVAH